MKVRCNVWIEIDGEVGLSEWRVALLEAVAATGSISAAAERQGVHFRVAWRKIREMEARLGQRLVDGHAGGVGGGGASLTPDAEAIVRRFRAFTAGMEDELEARFRRHFPAAAGDVPAAEGLSLLTYEGNAKPLT
jgi:molybdate transport system regulatory protein